MHPNTKLDFLWQALLALRTTKILLRAHVCVALLIASCFFTWLSLTALRIYFPLVISLSVRPIGSHGRPSVTLSPSVGWLADRLSLITLPSLPQARCEDFFLCTCITVAVYYLLHYNIHSWMLEQWATISGCTNTTEQQTGPSGCLGLICPSSSLFPAAPCNSSDFLHSSWLPGLLSQIVMKAQSEFGRWSFLKVFWAPVENLSLTQMLLIFLHFSWLHLSLRQSLLKKTRFGHLPTF